MYQFIQGLPKVELHLHIEGTLEPEMMFELAKRNGIELRYSSPEQIHQAYKFENLQSFLDIYYQGANVLITEQDFFDLTWAYMLRCQQDNVVHTELFFDPQTHAERGITFDTVINGIDRALCKAKQELGISSKLIMCFLRHLSEQEAFTTLQQALPYKEKIIAVGLDSSEVGHPPEKFANVFKSALQHGFLTVAHAGEEGPAQNIATSLDLLETTRIDHGVQCVNDPELLARLIEQKIPLTVCPLSNIALKVFTDMKQHNIVELLRQGVAVTINSDDPAYFGGYMTDNFVAVQDSLPMSKDELAQLTYNAINASFLADTDKRALIEKTQAYVLGCV